MKRLYFILAAIVFAGCAKISIEAPQKADLQPMTFSASVSEEPDVKAVIDGLEIKWSAGDEIGIYDGTAVRKFTLKEGADKTSAVFEGEAAKADSYIAVYPYSKDLAVSAGKITGLSVPCIQTAGKCPVIMTAECKDGGNALSFKSALAYVRVTPNFPCHKIVLETYDADSDGYDLCGDVELCSGSARVIGNACSHVILGGEIISGNSYCIGVAPKFLAKGFKVIFDEVMDEEYIPGYGLQYTRKSSATPDLLRGHILNLGEFSKLGTAWTENGVDLASFEMDGQDTEEFDDRAVYDWKDFMRIVSSCEKISSSKKSWRFYFQEDIDFGGQVLMPSIFNIWGGNVHLYGNGHKISNYIQGSMTVGKYGHAGLFAVEELQSFCVEDLCLQPKQFNVSSSDNEIYGGAFAGSIYCTDFIQFKNCSVSGDISVKCTGNQLVCAGGFAGFASAKGVESITDETQPGLYMENCLMEGSVSAYSKADPAYAGGFLGYVGGTDTDYICYITRSRNRAAVSATGDEDGTLIISATDAVAAGGIVGCDRDLGQDVVLRLNSCVNEGQVTAEAKDNDNAFAGGMVGCHDSDGSNITVDVHPYVHNCLNRGAITAVSEDAKAGGIAGYCYDDDTTFRNCVDDGILSSSDAVAHISGSDGAYDGNSPCFWTTDDGRAGIHKKGDKDGYVATVPFDALNAGNYDAKWVTRDGHLDLNIAY